MQVGVPVDQVAVHAGELEGVTSAASLHPRIAIDAPVWPRAPLPEGPLPRLRRRQRLGFGPNLCTPYFTSSIVPSLMKPAPSLSRSCETPGYRIL